MNSNRKILMTIKKIASKLMIGSLLLGIVILLSLRFRSVRGILISSILILVGIVASGMLGAAIGFLTLSICVKIGLWLYQLGSKLISAWRVKWRRSRSLYLPSSSMLLRSRSPRSQLRIALQRSRDERLSSINESIDIIRSRSPNLSIQDLYDLNRLNLELHQIIDEASWSPIRRERVARIAEIRNSRRASGRILPSGLTETIDRQNSDDDSEITISFEYESFDTDQIWSSELDGIGDLTCQYNARSVFIRCAVHPEAETCEGCRDYQVDETIDRSA
jgi:hypothetical protein